MQRVQHSHIAPYAHVIHVGLGSVLQEKAKQGEVPSNHGSHHWGELTTTVVLSAFGQQTSLKKVASSAQGSISGHMAQKGGLDVKVWEHITQFVQLLCLVVLQGPHPTGVQVSFQQVSEDLSVGQLQGLNQRVHDAIVTCKRLHVCDWNQFMHTPAHRPRKQVSSWILTACPPVQHHLGINHTSKDTSFKHTPAHMPRKLVLVSSWISLWQSSFHRDKSRHKAHIYGVNL